MSTSPITLVMAAEYARAPSRKKMNSNIRQQNSVVDRKNVDFARNLASLLFGREAP